MKASPLGVQIQVDFGKKFTTFSAVLSLRWGGGRAHDSVSLIHISNPFFSEVAYEQVASHVRRTVSGAAGAGNSLHDWGGGGALLWALSHVLGAVCFTRIVQRKMHDVADHVRGDV